MSWKENWQTHGLFTFKTFHINSLAGITEIFPVKQTFITQPYMINMLINHRSHRHFQNKFQTQSSMSKQAEKQLTTLQTRLLVCVNQENQTLSCLITDAKQLNNSVVGVARPLRWRKEPRASYCTQSLASFRTRRTCHSCIQH